MKALAGKMLLMAGGIVFALLIGEIAIRIVLPDIGKAAGWELKWMRNHLQNSESQYIVDPDFGFRPRLGTDLYNRHGTLVNEYRDEPAPGKQRLLFMGDSVTARGKIVQAIRKLYGDERFEYWNAGVESFNTVQELRYYRKYNAAIRPHHVILTFHLNDFETTPVTFYDSGRLVVFAPNSPEVHINPWLFKNSQLYRTVMGILIRITVGWREAGEATAAIEKEVSESLRELRDTLDAQHIALTVLVLPYFSPYEEWSPKHKQAREAILRILGELGISHFDLFDTEQGAIARGIEVMETPGDIAHPSDQVADEFAAYLYRNNLL